MVRIQLSGFRKAVRMAAGKATSRLREEFEALVLSTGSRTQVQNAAIDLLLRTSFLPQDQELVVDWLGNVFSSCPAQAVQRHLLGRLSRPRGWTGAHLEALIRAAAKSPYDRIRQKAVTLAASRQDWECLRSMTGDAHCQVRAEAVCALVHADPRSMGEFLDCLLRPGTSLEAGECADRAFAKHSEQALKVLGQALLDKRYRDSLLVHRLQRLGVESACRRWLQGSDPGDLRLAVALAGRLRLHRLSPQLLAVFEATGGLELRAKIIDAWEQMASPQALECLHVVTRGIDSASARRAEQALAKLPGSG